MPVASHRALFESAVESGRFSLRQLQRELERDGSLARCEALLRGQPQPVRDHVVRGLIRAVFLVEPVNRDVDSTKYAVRWGGGAQFAEFRRGDPRFAEFEECGAVWTFSLRVFGNSSRPWLGQRGCC